MTAVANAGRAALGGIEFNTIDDAGVLWGMDHLDGWGSPATDAAYTKRPGRHGSWRTNSTPTMGERAVAMGGIVQAPSLQQRVAAQDQLIAAIALDLTTLVVTEPDGTARWCDVQRDGEVIVTPLTALQFAWSAQVRAPDPRKYGDAIVQSTGLPQSSGGLTWPVTWPFTWTGVTTSGTVHIDNPGNLPSPVHLRITGPVTGAAVRHVASGKQLTIATSYPVRDGAYLDIDTEARTVLESGTASRNGYLTDRGWFDLDPGANDIIFTADAYQPAALLTVSAIPAYM